MITAEVLIAVLVLLSALLADADGSDSLLVVVAVLGVDCCWQIKDNGGNPEGVSRVER